MIERSVPRLTFEQMKSSAVRPGDVPVDRWETGLAIAEHLMHEGIPVNVLKESNVGINIPNRYYMTGTGVTVEHMPHWSYATIDNGLGRTHVPFTPDKKAASATGNNYLPQEDVLLRLKNAVVKAWR